MARSIARYSLWALMLAGCTSQPFCDFHDTAPIVDLPVPSGVASAYGWGTSLIHMRFEEGGIERDFLAAAGGPPSQTEVIQLAAGNELSIVASSLLTGICDREERDDPGSDCYERHAGVGLAYRSSWEGEGDNCVAVGMAGHELPGGVGFWCAGGTSHRRQAYLMTLPEGIYVQAMGHVLTPVERIFVGTSQSLLLLDGDSQQLIDVTWDDPDLPGQFSSVEAIATFEVTEEESPERYLVAIGVPSASGGSVLVGEVASPAEGESLAPLTPRACVTSSTDIGFGSVIALGRLAPDDPPSLLVSSGRGVEGRTPAVRVFDLDLTVAPEEVTCEAEAVMSLECGQVDGYDVDCAIDRSGFGGALALGNIDDTPEVEVIVGCPGATADGFERAGAGYVFRPGDPDWGERPLTVLADSGEDRTDAALGAGVLIPPLGDRAEPILAAPGEEGLLMFLCTGVGDSAPDWDSPVNQAGALEDPRCRNEGL